jgi:hypothetical protein
MRRWTFSGFGAALALVSAPALAADANCFGAEFADGPRLEIARIKPGAARVNFIRNGDACPSDAAACRDKAFLAPGDLVVRGRKSGGFVCADFLTGKNARSGWLPEAALEPAPLATKPQDWRGDWKRVEAGINITLDAKGNLNAKGEATFGALDPARVKRGAVNMGDFTGALELAEGHATFANKNVADDYSCLVRMARAGAFLFVQDNRQCGGNNVSFTGLYRR